MRPCVLLAAALMLLQGCAGQLAEHVGDTSAPAPSRLSGAQVGVMAERVLEELHPGMAPGRMTCPGLEFAVGRSIRCEQVADLPDGRRIRVGGTVTVTGLEDGGSLHVQLDDTASEFGVAGSQVARVLEDQIREGLPGALGGSPVSARCPYLKGVIGTRIRCTVTASKTRRPVTVVVTATDAATSTTTYRFDDGQLKAVQRSLPYVAAEPSLVVDLRGDHRAAA